MRNNRGFIHFLLMFFIVGIALFSIVLLAIKKPNLKNSSQNPSVDSSPIITNKVNTPTSILTVKDLWKVPKLPEGFNWQIKLLKKEEAMDYRMFWDSQGNGSSYGDILFPTTLYFTDLNYNDPKDIMDSNDFAVKFGKEMEANGWNFDVNYNSKRIIGMAADGVFGSSYGTVKMISNQIKSVGYSYNLKSASWDGPGSDVVCPCQLHLEIFIGDEVNLKDINFE